MLFPCLGPPVFRALGSSLSVRLVDFGVKSYQNQAKTLALQGIQAKTGIFSDAAFDIGGGAQVREMCPKNGSVEPAKRAVSLFWDRRFLQHWGLTLSVWRVFPGKVEFFQGLPVRF